MKVSKIRLLAAASLATALGAGAPGAQAAVHNATLLKADGGIAVFGSSLHQRYKEYNSTGTSPDREHGAIKGVGLDLKALAPFGLYSDMRVNYNRGDTDYVGQTMGGIPSTGTTYNQIANVAWRFGWGFGIGQNAAIIPYVGFGVHVWRRTVGYGTASAYDEAYDHFDLGLGLKAQYAVTKSLVVGANVFVARTHRAQMRSDIPNSTGSTLTFDLGSGAADRAGIDVDYDVAGPLHLIAAVDYYHLEYGKSDTVAGLFEPTSHTNQLTYEVGAGLHF